MYWLYGIDTVLRITFAIALLFVAVPALAWRRPRTFSRLEWFWWNFGVGITILTLAGQVFTLLNVAGTLSYLTLIAAIIIVCRARLARVSPLRLIGDAYRNAVLYVLRAIDGREDVRERVAAAVKRSKPRRLPSLAWIAIVAVAGVTRLYRPFATANLGYSDTYVHLYLMRLLDEGRQIDPAWGPYPRGMHFLILAIQRLTNADTILLMNFFGACSGVLMALAAAYAARRVAKSNVAALVTGLVFATMIGGAHQYFLLGGSVSAPTAHDARAQLAQPYSDLATNGGEFDVLLTAFQRETSTLPQELAIVLLFPAALFLLDWLKECGDGRLARRAAGEPPAATQMRLIGFMGCTAAIAAIHSGVVVPLVLLCAAVTLAHLFTLPSNLEPRTSIPEELQVRGSRFEVRGKSSIFTAALYGAASVAIGSTWMIGFLFHRRVVTPNSHVGSTALYYFPFLKSFMGGGGEQEVAFMSLTPFLIAIAITAVIVGVVAIRERYAPALFIAIATLFFTITHAASTLGMPEIVEVRRNVTWLAMAIAILIGVAVEMVRRPLPRIVPAIALALWAATLPNIFGPFMRTRLLDYSGYGSTTYAVLLMSHRLEPFTWTLVSYGQEYPMVLGRGFHLNGADFVDRFDPAETPVRIPTPYIFIAVEKKPHRFQINTWSARFDRAAVEERLQTWCTLYGMTHRDMRVFLDDDNVRVYEIARPEGRT